MKPMLLIIFVCVQVSSCTQSDVPAGELVQTSPFTSSSIVSTVNSESETERIPSSDSDTISTVLIDSDSNEGNLVTTSAASGRSVAKISWNPVSTVVLSTEALTKNINDESTSSSKNLPNSFETDASLYQTTQSIYDNLDHGENELDSDVSKNTLKTTLNPDLHNLYSYQMETNGSEDSTNNPLSAGTNFVASKSDEELTSKKTTTLASSEYNAETSTGSLTTVMYEHITHTTILGSLIKSTSTSMTDISNSTSFPTERDVSTPVHESNVPGLNSLETTKGISETSMFGDPITETENIKDTTLVTESIKPLTASSELFDGEIFQQNSTIENFSTTTVLHFTTKEQNLDLDIHTKMSETLNAQTSSLSKQLENSTELPITSELESMITDESITEMFTSKYSNTLPPDTSPDIRISMSSTPTFYINPLSENSSETNTPRDGYLSTAAEITFIHSNSTFNLNVSNFPTHTDAKTFTSSIYDSTRDIEARTVYENIIHSSTTSISSESETVSERTITISSSEVTETPNISSSLSVSETTDNKSSYIRKTTVNSSEIDSLNVQDISVASNTEKDVSQFSTTAMSTYTDNPTSTTHLFSILMHTGTPSSTDSDIATERTYRINDINLEQNVPTTTASQLQSTILSNFEDSNSSFDILTTIMGTDIRSTSDVHTEQDISQTISPLSSTTTVLTKSSSDHNVYSIPTFLSTEETTVTKVESFKITDPVVTLLSDKYSSSTTPVSVATWSVLPETHREGKHIPFSTISTITSRNGFYAVTTDRMPKMETAINETEVHYKQMQFEDLHPLDRTNMITAIIQFPANSVNKTGMKLKLAKTHVWLNDVLTKEFQNWTRDPFEESEEPINDTPFGNISIFYVIPTPETNDSYITLTFIVYNAWKNETLPVHFVLGILNFYSKDLKESINASAAYFYHGLLTENYDLLSAMLEKYGIIIFTICLAVVGISVLICVVVFYRRKTRQSVHYLADSKLQHNMQEAVGIDLTPASIILQDEKEEKGNKICDDEGWLVPITDIPLAEDGNGPNVQDTKL
ncbi:uncharacterized protein NPIL_4761 [Nephila pilipes]|uniref:Uncharacterized protein n=1 Tax=Nephila pilipes TaxID=299642 RepID=A0A8X6PPG6_NEPPI|nr:uncharacterized protein NPIL_4761 [Nephila pilipes]